MKYLLLFFAVLLAGQALHAQTAPHTYIITSDSTKLTGCDSNELIIENHTQAIPGFLFNTGKGRTKFLRGLISLNDSQYLVGADTLNLNNATKALTGDNGIQRINNVFEFGNDDNDPYGEPAYQNRNTHYNQDGYIFNWMTMGSIFNMTEYDAPTTETNVLAPYYLARFKAPDPGQAGILMEANESLYWEGPLNWITFKNHASNAVKYYWYGDDMCAQISTVTRQGADGNAYASLQFQVANDTSNGGINNNTMAMAIYPSMPSAETGQIALPTVGIKRLNIADYNDIWVASEFPQQEQNPWSRMVVNAHNYPIIFANLPQTNYDTVNFKPLVINPYTGAINYMTWTGQALSGASSDVIRSSLAVNGTITAKKLQLSPTGWPDYVFDGSYKLMPLHDLDQYIVRHKHLPGVIPADEAASKGIEVGETQAVLLKKIEELTLYTIDQDKQLREMRQELNELKQLIGKKPTN